MRSSQSAGLIEYVWLSIDSLVRSNWPQQHLTVSFNTLAIQGRSLAIESASGALHRLTKREQCDSVALNSPISELGHTSDDPRLAAIDHPTFRVHILRYGFSSPNLPRGVLPRLDPIRKVGSVPTIEP